jgi:hypothetical protein
MLAAIAAIGSTAAQVPEMEIPAAGLSRNAFISCVPERIVARTFYRARQPGPNPDVIDIDRRDMTPAYRLTLVEERGGFMVKVAYHEAPEPVVDAVRACMGSAPAEAAPAQAK